MTARSGRRAWPLGSAALYDARVSLSEARSLAAPCNVAVGIVLYGRRVLLVQRPPAGPLARLWEFPGGKVEAGETPEGALRRELWEEVGLTVGSCALLAPLRHDYAHIRVRLLPFITRTASPCVRLCGPAAYQWVRPAQLAGVRILPGSAALARAVAFRAR